MHTLDQLAQTAIALLLREPFYAHLLSGLNKEVVGPGHPVDTLAVGHTAKGYTLYINDRFWNTELTRPEHRYGVLKHELLHLVFRHLQVSETLFDRHLLNVAFDLVVNQYVERSLLPDDSLFLDTFPDLALLPGQTWFYYYKQLESVKKSQDGEDPNAPARESLQRIRADSHGLERHQPWQAIDNQSELEKSLAETQLDGLLRSAHQRSSAQAWGSLPSDVREQLQSFLIPAGSRVDWRRVLRLFAGTTGKTYLKTTLKRPSKRYGTVPGNVLRHKQHLLVAIDTSGSIGQPELNLFFSELFFLWRAGATIDVLECDTRIHQQYSYRGRTPQAATGRGGTDFQEPVALANREKPDGLLYFTDGFAPTLQTPPRVPTLWVLTPGGLADSHPQYSQLPGRKVRFAGGA